MKRREPYIGWKSILAAFVIAFFIVYFTDTPRHVVYIKNDPGGLISEYASKYDNIMQRGQYVHISGFCASACTMVLVVPRDHVCAEASAVFGFHALTDMDGKIDLARTKWFYHAFYPPVIQQRLAMHPPTTDLLVVRATMLVPECKI